MLPRAYRLTRGEDFARVRRDGLSRAHPLLVAGVVRSDVPRTRVGLSVSKKVGSAVARNRAKRLLREAVRVRLSRLRSGHDIVLIGRQGLASCSLAEVSDALETVLRRAQVLLPDSDSRERGRP